MEDHWWRLTPYPSFLSQLKVEFDGLNTGNRSYFLIACDGRDAIVLDITSKEHRIPVELFARIQFKKYDMKIDDVTGHLFLKEHGSEQWVDYCPWTKYDARVRLVRSRPVDLTKMISPERMSKESVPDIE